MGRVGLVGLLLTATVGVLWKVASPRLAERIKASALPRLSRALGRELTAGRAELSLLPLGFRLHEVRVAGEAGEPLFLSAGQIFVSPRLWPLIRGRKLQLSNLEVEDLDLVLVRRQDGTWSLPRRAGAGEGNASARAEVPIDRASLRRGRVRLMDCVRDCEEGVLASELEAELRREGRVFKGVLHSAPSDGEPPRLDARFTLERSPRSGSAEADPWPAIQGRLVLRNQPLWLLQPFLTRGLARLTRDGLLELTADVSMREDGAYAVDGDVRLTRLDFKQQPAATSFHVRGAVHPLKPRGSSFDFTALRLQGPGFDATGTATLTGFTEVRFALEGPLLDLGALLKPRKRPGGPSPREHPWASPATRRVLAALHLAGNLSFDRLVYKRLSFSRLRAKADVSEGVLSLPSVVAKLYGGRINGAGSHVDLSRPVPAWRLTAQLEQVNLARAAQALTGRKPMEGELTATLDLAGVGGRWKLLRNRLRGSGSLAIVGGKLASLELEEKVAAPLRAPLSEATQTLRSGARLDHVSASFEVRDGWLTLRDPLRFDVPFGRASARGRIGLEGQLDLEGTAALSSDFVGRALGRALRPNEPLQVPLRLVGTLSKPKVSTRPGEVVRNLLSGGRAPGNRQVTDEGAPPQVQGRSGGAPH